MARKSKKKKASSRVETMDPEEEEAEEQESPQVTIDAARLAQLIGDDEEEDEEEDKDQEAERLRMAALLRRGVSDDPETPPAARAATPTRGGSPIVVRVVATQPQEEEDDAEAEAEEGEARSAMDVISSKLTAMTAMRTPAEDEEEEEELDFRGGGTDMSQIVEDYVQNDECAEDESESQSTSTTSLRLRASRHEARAPAEIALEVVWENQTRDGLLGENAKRLAARALGRQQMQQEERPWRPCRGDAKIWGTDLKPSFESPTSPRVGQLFSLAGRVFSSNDGEQLPDRYTWRWLSPWQVDGRVHGSDRLCEDTNEDLVDDWIYASSWPAPGESYSKRCRPEHRVRCRRWVRPRERLGTHDVLDALLRAAPERDAVADAFVRHQDDRTGIVDLDALVAELGLANRDVTPPPSPDDSTAKSFDDDGAHDDGGASNDAGAAPAAGVEAAADEGVLDDAGDSSSQTIAQPPLPPSALGELAKERMGEVAASVRALLARKNLSKADPANPAEETGVVLDFVWQNQRYAPSLRGTGVWTGQALLRRPPFEASRPELADLFKRHGGPPNDAADVVDDGLPDDWKWISPWLVDSVSFGADRSVNDADKLQGNDTGDGWLYAFDWPTNDRGYSPHPQTLKSFVRCRRWVRPRERIVGPDASPSSSFSDASPGRARPSGHATTDSSGKIKLFT